MLCLLRLPLPPAASDPRGRALSGQSTPVGPAVSATAPPPPPPPPAPAPAPDRAPAAATLTPPVTVTGENNTTADRTVTGENDTTNPQHTQALLGSAEVLSFVALLQINVTTTTEVDVSMRAATRRGQKKWRNRAGRRRTLLRQSLRIPIPCSHASAAMGVALDRHVPPFDKVRVPPAPCTLFTSQ